MRCRPAAALPLLVAMWTAPALAAEGERLFELHCAACHSVRADAPPRPGPTLAALIGRPVAGDAAFDYSPAFRSARNTGRTWNEATLRRFLDDPDDMFPGLWMSPTGLRREPDITAVVEYLARK